MQLPVSRAKDFSKEKVNADFPAIRLFTVASRASEKAADDVKGSWEVCTPETAARFSAALYVFGREVHQQLRLPVGPINCWRGGTPIQSWMPCDSLKASPNYDDAIDPTKVGWAYFREGQSRTLSVPNTGMAVTIDLG
jgi:sialate O-acetylesterase